MNNLKKITDVWDNLDASYERMNGGLSKSDFLRKLLANGDEKAVESVLGKVSSCVESSEDMVKFSALQKIMLTLVANIDKIPDNLGSLNSFVRKIVSNKSRPKDFSKFVDSLNLFRPRVVVSTPFAISSEGVDLVTAEYQHSISKFSDGCIVAKTEEDVENLRLYSGDNVFVGRVSKFLNARRKRIVDFPIVFIDAERDLQEFGPMIDGFGISKGKKKYRLVRYGVQTRVEMV